MELTNFYLELLNKQISKLTKVMDNKDSYPNSVYNCILAGIVIQANSIVETCMMDFSTDKFSEVASKIYSARQLLIHYSDYRAFDDIESIASEIINKFNKVYKSEKAYFDKILTYQNTSEHNVVIRKSKDVVYDEFNRAYIFINGDIEIIVSASKVTVIKDLKKRKDIAYIVNCDNDMNYIYTNQHHESEYIKLKAPEELQRFFINEFKPIAIDYIAHKNIIKQMIDGFYSGSFSAIKTHADSILNNHKDIYIDTSKLLGDFFINGVVYKEFLGANTFKNSGAPMARYEDFVNIKNLASEDLVNAINVRDYFFIKKCEAMMSNINDELRKNASMLDDDLLMKMKISMLINFVDQSVKNISTTFTGANEDFEKLHLHLLDYRNFFAHNIYSLKPNLGTRILEEFLEVARGYVSIVSSLNIDKITNVIEKEERTFLSIEKEPSDFVNSKYEQYVSIDPHTYIGNKLYYSTRGSNYDKIIGLIPVDKHGDYHGAYYEKRASGYVAKTIKVKGGKNKPLMVRPTNFPDGEELLMDVNIVDLLYINAAYSHKVGGNEVKNHLRKTNKKLVVFKESEDNNYTRHAASLNHLISNYFQQRYLPYELARRTSIRFTKTGDDIGYFEILDIDGNVIADVVDDKLFKRYNMSKDSNQVFSVSDITHDFSIKKGR